MSFSMPGVEKSSVWHVESLAQLFVRAKREKACKRYTHIIVEESPVVGSKTCEPENWFTGLEIATAMSSLSMIEMILNTPQISVSIQ